MANVLVEIIASSPDDCVAIDAAGAGRVELCAALVLGGLTPSFGAIAESKARVRIPIMAMVRPRAAGMAYSQSEFATMERDIEASIQAGADGLVFGVLQDDGRIDTQRMASLAARCGSRQKVCHRAFDVTPDPFDALETLIDLGFTRVLTSGQKPTALAGADLIRRLIEKAAGRIEILPGAGIDATTASQLIAETGCDQIHLAAFKRAVDPSGSGNPAVQFSGAEPPPEGEYDLADGAMVAELIRGLSDG
ncbi:MAG: copper homeostasis protein CutC [Armatimonadota bacterium]|nr:copper homeostasis protein CutC [Armatimonadota bacterium]